MGGLFRRMPHTAITTIVGALALTGVWPFSGFYSKDAILAGVYESGLTLPFVALTATVFLTAVYAFRMVFLAFFGTRVAEGAAHDPPLVMRGPLWVLALFSVALGPFGEAFSGLLAQRGSEGLARQGSAGFLPLLSLTLAVSGILAAWLIYERGLVRAETLARRFGPLYLAATRRYWVDDAYEAGYRRGLLVIASGVGWVDRYLVDGLVNGASALTARAGRNLRTMQSGRAQDYLYGVAAGLLLFLVWGLWRGIG
jgi:NADH-quinone oxidoreductase subunit L